MREPTKHKMPKMRKLFVLVSITTLLACNQSPVDKNNRRTNPKPVSDKVESDNFGIVIHGGAGTILKENMTDSLEIAYKTVLEEAIRVGHGILANGGTSLEAVQRTINVMEDHPLFNAGKGAVFTNEGKNELDAAIMDGETLKAGAVAGVTTVKTLLIWHLKSWKIRHTFYYQEKEQSSLH